MTADEEAERPGVNITNNLMAVFCTKVFFEAFLFVFFRSKKISKKSCSQNVGDINYSCSSQRQLGLLQHALPHVRPTDTTSSRGSAGYFA